VAPWPKKDDPDLTKGDVIPFPKDRVTPAKDLGQNASVVEHPVEAVRRDLEENNGLNVPTKLAGSRLAELRAKARKPAPVIAGKFPMGAGVDQGKPAEVVPGPVSQRSVVKQPGDAGSKAVQNLGWLHRNWKGVERMELASRPDGGYLTAHMRDGRKYETPFADEGVMMDWINRPVFRGMKASYNGKEFEIGDRNFSGDALRKKPEPTKPIMKFDTETWTWGPASEADLEMLAKCDAIRYPEPQPEEQVGQVIEADGKKFTVFPQHKIEGISDDLREYIRSKVDKPVKDPT
jgi:hypothetical protein